jgi:NADPH2:quinone reductase
MTNQTQAIQYETHGGPDVLKLRDVDLPAPGAGEALIRQTAIGVNYLDIYERSGADLSIPLPAGIGVEGVGIIESIGFETGEFSVGDRVGYIGGPPGAYATRRIIPISRLVRLPDTMDDKIAAAMLFKGLTAEYLIHRCVSVEPGQTILFHAASGGVGSIAAQWLKHRGATVIGTVGSPEKMDRARENGCDHVFLSNDPDLAQKVHDTSGGAHVVYDSIGATTFVASLDSLRPRGTLVSIGAASGPPPEINVSELARRGSLFLTRPSIAHYTSDPNEYRQAANRFFDAMANGDIAPSEITVLKLSEAAQAHQDMEGRKTIGSVVLVPDTQTE